MKAETKQKLDGIVGKTFLVKDQVIKQNAYNIRGPMRSAINPPGICKAAYVQPKAEKINPI